MARPFYQPSERSYIPQGEAPEKAPDTKGKLKPGPGSESFKLAGFWKDQAKDVEQFNERFYQRGNVVLKRYRDERMRTEGAGIRKMNLLWANIKIMKPAIYSRCPDPVVDRKFLDKDPIGRLSSVILERVIRSQMEHGFHSAMNKAVYDRLLPGRGQIWVRYEPVLEEEESVSIPTSSQNTLEDSLVKIAKDARDREILDETESERELESTGTTLATEKIICDYVDWRDFYIFPPKARTWEEVQAVGKRVYMSKQEAKERFGDEIGDQMHPDTQPNTSGSNRQPASDTTLFRDINDRSIVVFEIWNKSDKRVYWVSTGYEYLCDVRPDPYGLKKFFPCPEPLSATLTNDTLTPVPDYYEYQDQAIQIDELTQRIAMLTKACKVAGAYNSAAKPLARIFEETMEAQLIPVDQWASFAEKGGLKGAMDFVPLDQIQSCIKTLQEVRQQCQQDLDQITGISDVVRGTTDSRETLGGIRLKNNNAGTRLSESQKDVERFAAEVIELIGELSAKHFEDETLVECSGILFDEEMQPEAVLREFEPVMPGFDQLKKSQGGPAMPPPPAGQAPGQPPGTAPGGVGAGAAPNSVPPVGPNNVVPFPGSPEAMAAMSATPMPDPQQLIMEKLTKAIDLLREDVPRGYRISIETDSTVFGDRVQERQDASDFIEALGGFMQGFEQMGQAVPEALPLLARALQWATRKFRIGRDLESEVNSFTARMEKKAKLMIENPQPSPEDKKLQSDKELKQMELQGNMAIADKEAQRQEQDDMRQAQIQQVNDERDAEKARQEDERTAQLAQMDLEIKREELEFKRQENAMKLEMMRAQMQIDIQKMQLKVQGDQQTAQTNMQVKEHEHGLNMEMADKQHQHGMTESTVEHSNKMQQSEVAAKGTEQKAEIQEKAHGQKKEIMDHTTKHKKQQMAMKPKPKGK